MTSNPSNDFSQYGHIHEPQLHIVDEVENASLRSTLDLPRTLFTVSVGAASLGVLGERFASMFDVTKSQNISFGLGSAAVMGVITTAYGIRNYRKN